MGRYSLRIVACTLIIGWTFAGTASAQTPGSFGAGLSFMSLDGTAMGFVVNASKDLTSGTAAIGPVGDFSLHSDNGATWTWFGGGVRVTGRSADAVVIPFGQFLAGASVINAIGTESFLTLTFGGGVHVPIGEQLNILFQFDLLNVRGEGESDTGKRTTIGISVPLGGR